VQSLQDDAKALNSNAFVFYVPGYLWKAGKVLSDEEKLNLRVSDKLSRMMSPVHIFVHLHSNGRKQNIRLSTLNF